VTNPALSQANPETRRLIVLSTAHLSKETAQAHSTYQENTLLWPIPYGYICWMWDPESLNEEKETPHDLQIVLQGLKTHYNVQEGDYIRFDCDGPVLRKIPTYPW
jgi:hypothetical protein